MKNIRRVIAIFLLLILYAYIVNITGIPENIFLYQDSSLNIRLCPFVKITGEEYVSSNGKSSNYNLGLSIGNTKIKDVNIKVANNIRVIPVRKIDWIKIIYKRSYDSTVFLK